jgi:hypothetical protein
MVLAVAWGEFDLPRTTSALPTDWIEPLASRGPQLSATAPVAAPWEAEARPAEGS